MNTSAIILFNMAGAVCASDMDHSVYSLSKHCPVALVVNAGSKIPWKAIINAYVANHPLNEELDFQQYTQDFESFLHSYSLSRQLPSLVSSDTNIIFFGYGKDDIFPSVFDVNVQLNETSTHLEYAPNAIYHQISLEMIAFYHTIGNFDALSPILKGISPKVSVYIQNQQVEMFQQYRNRILEHFTGSPYYDVVLNKLNQYDIHAATAKRMEDTHLEIFAQQIQGLDTFSIADLTSAAEILVNANNRIEHLRKGGVGRSGLVEELAIMTRTEGLTWLKHKIFAN